MNYKFWSKIDRISERGGLNGYQRSSAHWPYKIGRLHIFSFAKGGKHMEKTKGGKYHPVPVGLDKLWGSKEKKRDHPHLRLTGPTKKGYKNTHDVKKRIEDMRTFLNIGRKAK